MFRALLAAALLLIAACAAPFALPPEDRSAIAQRIAGFERAFVQGNTTEIINVVPPRLITAIARDGGVAETALRREMANLTREATARINVVSFGMALDDARFLTTPAGRPYGLIPTRTVIETPTGTRLQSDNTTLTFEEGGQWYLIRIDEGRQMELMREVYPDFEGVTFPQGTTKALG